MLSLYFLKWLRIGRTKCPAQQHSWHHYRSVPLYYITPLAGLGGGPSWSRLLILLRLLILRMRNPCSYHQGTLKLNQGRCIYALSNTMPFIITQGTFFKKPQIDSLAFLKVGHKKAPPLVARPLRKNKFF